MLNVERERTKHGHGGLFDLDQLQQQQQQQPYLLSSSSSSTLNQGGIGIGGGQIKLEEP